jgi:hypothetical protein
MIMSPLELGGECNKDACRFKRWVGMTRPAITKKGHYNKLNRTHMDIMMNVNPISMSVPQLPFELPPCTTYRVVDAGSTDH